LPIKRYLFDTLFNEKTDPNRACTFTELSFKPKERIPCIFVMCPLCICHVSIVFLSRVHSVFVTCIQCLVLKEGSNYPTIQTTYFILYIYYVFIMYFITSAVPFSQAVVAG